MFLFVIIFNRSKSSCFHVTIWYQNFKGVVIVVVVVTEEVAAIVMVVAVAVSITRNNCSSKGHRWLGVAGRGRGESFGWAGTCIGQQNKILVLCFLRGIAGRASRA